MDKIMIVDDEKAIRESLSLAVNFEQYGFKVCATAKNGEDALEKMSEHHPDVILLDVCMPVLDGLGFLQRLHEKKPERLPYVVMLSGYSDFEYARTAMRYGVKAYLTKPLDEDEIGQILLDLRGELNKRKQLQGDEKLELLTRALQKMYHDGDGDRTPYRGCFLMHCVVLGAESEKGVYATVRECMEEVLPRGKAAFFRNRGSVYSYLIFWDALEDYQRSVTLFARHILYQMKKSGAEGALLFDETLFVRPEGTFRSDYDTRLYGMLAEIFWKKERIVQRKGNFAIAPEAQSPEQEEVDFEKLKEAAKRSDEAGLTRSFQTMMEDLEKNQPDIIYLQRIGYRFYYVLTDLLRETGEDAPELVINPLDLRDAPCFIGFAAWKSALWEQVYEVFAFLANAQKGRASGLGDQVISYLRQHFREQISLKDAADHFYVSSAYLGRCVLKATGVSFKQYVNDLRMEEARRLLRQTDRLVYEIAEEVGFKESKYFVSKFTAEEGKTPLEYRKATREQYLRKEQ